MFDYFVGLILKEASIWTKPHVKQGGGSEHLFQQTGKSIAFDAMDTVISFF